MLTLIIAILTLASAPISAQEMQQPRWLIDTPTAGLLERGSLAVDLRLYKDSGILTQMEVGVFDRAGVGFSFGGTNIVGNQAAVWNPRVEFTARIRVIDEGMAMPAVAIGFHSQGYGDYADELERYTTKSRGFYAVLSKNYGSPFGDLGLHGGMNRSLEDKDGDGDLSGFAGVDLGLGTSLSLLAEYDFAMNDNEDNTLGSGKGRMNLGARWAATRQLAIEMDFKNLFRDGERNPQPDRELRLIFYEKF